MVLAVALLDKLKKRDQPGDNDPLEVARPDRQTQPASSGSAATGKPDYLQDFPESIAEGWTGVRNPDAPPSPKKARAQAIVYGMLAALPVSVLALLVGIASLASGSSEADAPAGFLFEGAAEAAAADYLGGREFSIPLDSGVNGQARVLSEEQQELVESGDIETAEPEDFNASSISLIRSSSNTLPGANPNAPDRYFEIHTFAVTTEAGDYFWISVTLTDKGGPVLAALPQIEPAVVGAEPGIGDQGIVWSEVLGSKPMSEQAAQRVGRWATAYGADDREALRELTGDERTTVDYRGLGGYTVVGDAVILSAGGPADGDQLVARVQVTYAAKSNPDLVLVVENDVLVQNLDGSLPVITAWGPVGSGTLLVPFQNALPFREEPAGDAPAPDDTNETTTSTTEGT